MTLTHDIQRAMRLDQPAIFAVGRGQRALTWVLAALLALPVSPGVTAVPDPATLCDAVGHQVAQESGVPQAVLAALMLTETGRLRDGAMRPWPWTVNMEGAGHWFDDADSAQAFVYDHFRQGARSFDVGCFQINYRWHHSAFASIEEMFEPLANARYAAQFLTGLYSELGSWEKAAGAYHSRTPELAERYQARFSRFHAQVSDAPLYTTADAGPALAALARTEPATPRVNPFPLLLAGGRGAMGSLVPVGAQAARPLFSGSDRGQSEHE